MYIEIAWLINHRYKNCQNDISCSDYNASGVCEEKNYFLIKYWNVAHRLVLESPNVSARYLS